MTYRDWHVGMKVVCVDDAGHYAPWGRCDMDMDGLKVRRVYTIRMIGFYRDQLAVWLDEIVRPIRGDNAELYGEPGYSVLRFRPVQPRATDISVFTSMLTGVKEREPA